MPASPPVTASGDSRRIPHGVLINFAQRADWLLDLLSGRADTEGRDRRHDRSEELLPSQVDEHRIRKTYLALVELCRAAWAPAGYRARPGRSLA